MTLFIIFGIDSKTNAKPVGTSYCPACQSQRTFAELRQSRRLSLFFVPLIPLGSSSLGRVQCTTCGSEFDPSMIN